MDDFAEMLHVGSMINVWGYWTSVDSEREQTAHIRSALVTPNKALALLRALGTANDVHDYLLPSANSDMEIEEFGFALKGWIVDHSRDRGLDGQDRWAGGISYPPPMPARYVIDAMCLETDSDNRFWRDREESVVMESRVWGHYDEAKRHESNNPEHGSRLHASLEFLTLMLGKLGLDLIIEVQIERCRRYRSYERGIEDDKERIPTQAKLYLLGANGRIHTI